MSSPRVSVVIPAYNSEKYIAATLDSVFAQTCQDLEVIVIDDGSTDGTGNVLRRYEGRIVYLKNNHGGPASSRNRGIAEARGAHVAFLDSDDLWHPEKLEKQLALAEKFADYGIITTDAAVFNQNGTTAESSKAGKYIPSGYVLEYLLFDNWIGTSCALVRRECFDKVGMFDVEDFVWGEDWVMWMRIAARYPVYFLDEVLVRYRVHAQGYSRANMEKHYQDLLYDLDKMQRTIPELAAKPHLVREAKYRLSLKSGWSDLNELALGRARERLRRAVGYKPSSVKAWAMLGIALAPEILLRSAKQALRAARQRFSAA